MKNTFILTTLLVVLSIACQKDESIGPPELLYQRWHLDKMKRIGTEAWMIYNLDAIHDMEYRPDGTLVHRKNDVIQTRPVVRPTGLSVTVSGYTIQNLLFVLRFDVAGLKLKPQSHSCLTNCLS